MTTETAATNLLTVATLDTMLIAVIPAGDDIEAAIKAEEENAGCEFDHSEIVITESVKHVADVDAYDSKDWVFWDRDRSGYVLAVAKNIVE